ncbi:MAG: alpha-L-fucosidase [Bacteroidetes bacterium]|nr:alpha-L-fucosidase [Bacteroidota bacterium]
MKKIYSFLLITLFSTTVLSQNSTSASGDRMQWWREARFGMFIHWGLYAVPAGEWNGKTGYGEWIRNSAEIPIDVYDHFREKFNPVKFDADDWVRMARDAGMKYIVITSKHHDGFCMFGTDQTDFNIINTPFHHDPMKDLAAACRKYGLKFCFYYSIMDWHHPDYLPRRSWEKFRPVTGAEFRKYVFYMKAELKELLTNYGDIGVLWFDGEWENTWNEKFGKEIYSYCRSLQPNIIINNRVGAGRMDMEGLTKEGAFGGDFGTPEQQIPATGLTGVDWETCMTMNDHWGYNKNDKNFKSANEMVRMLADIASKGGNYLLNVGPTSEGVFPDESIERLNTIGGWMKVNGESVWGTKASPFRSLDWGRCTRKEIPGGVRLYLHVFNWPETSNLILPGILNEPAKAFMLSDVGQSPLKVTRFEDALIIALPVQPSDSLHPVVVIDLKGKLDLTEPPRIVSDFNAFVDSLKIKLQTDRENVEIRYTLDGKDCDLSSPVYKVPFYIRKALQINARCFRDGKPVSGMNSAIIRNVDAAPAVKVNNQAPGLSYAYYEGNWDSIPEFSGMKPHKEGVLPNIILNPATAKEFYGFSFGGFVNIPATGMYAFYTESDDGSTLWIDGKKLVDNDGLHGAVEVEAVVALKKGFHSIRVDYFNKSGSDGITVSIRSTTLKKQVMPDGMLFHEVAK